jgi:DNA invertase Pin-like site-specific DNA recombinase
MVAARNFAAELEREKISQRTREHLLTKARRGLNTGGRVYGYDNVPVADGCGRRVEFRINEEQATVLREQIFGAYAAGDGFAKIARNLNDRRIPAPRAGKRGTASWLRRASDRSCATSAIGG